MKLNLRINSRRTLSRCLHYYVALSRTCTLMIRGYIRNLENADLTTRNYLCELLQVMQLLAEGHGTPIIQLEVYKTPEKYF